MQKDEIRAKLSELGQRIAQGSGMEFVHLDLERQRGAWFVRLFIDKPGGVSLDDCADISGQFGAELDARELVNGSYTLEVSSPGLDRPLRSEADFRRFTGRLVAISTFEPILGRRHFVGRLISFESGKITVMDAKSEIYAIPFKKVSKARLEVELSGSGADPLTNRGKRNE